MRRVREDRDVSLATIHEQTQIAESLLESFESGGLYDHSAFNEVYLRSFVRAYATVVGISPDTAVANLESALRGKYRNDLAVEYLQEDPMPPPDDPPEDSDSEAPADSPPPTDAGSSVGSEEEVEPDHEVDEEEGSDHGPESPPVDAEDAPPQPATVGSQDSPQERQFRAPVLSIGAALLMLGVIGVGLWYALGAGSSPSTSSPLAVSDTPSAGTSSPPASSPSSASADSAAEPSSEPDPSAPLPLGDTLYLTLRADSAVTGLRLRRDEDLRRPYWIEEGEAATFPFTSRAIIENDLEDVTVYLENRRVRIPPDTARRIVIDRERASALLNDAEEAPAAWSSPPDTIPSGPLAVDTSAAERP